MTDETTSPEINELPEPTQPPTETAVLRNGAKTKRFSSRQPNNALLWALIDDSELGKEEHDEAVAIMENWQTGPWKGMVWRGIVGNDRVWNGSAWEAATDQPVAYKPYYPEGSLPQVSSELTKIHAKLAPGSVSADMLNQQYASWVLNPELEEAEFHVTLSAFVRTAWRTAQCRMLLSDSPETWMEPDDVFADFVLELLRRIGKGQYTHVGNLDGWIAAVWDRYFFPEKQTEIYGYLETTRFVNNVDPYDPAYKHQKHCLNTKNITQGTDEADASPKSMERVLRELNDPRTVFGKLPEDTKAMIRSMASGKSYERVAADAGVSTRTVRGRVAAIPAELAKVSQ